MNYRSIALSVALLFGLLACAEVQEPSASTAPTEPALDLSTPIDENGTTLAAYRLKARLKPGHVQATCAFMPRAGSVNCL